MKNIIFATCFILFNGLSFAQSVYFTSRNTQDEDVFFKVDVNLPFVYENITDVINSNALYSGINKGPLIVSHNGNFLIFQSDRFANSTITGGYEAITICSSDFSTFEVPTDAFGNAFHSEGIMQVSNDGQSIYFVQGGGTHGRDIYKIVRNGGFWSDPIELTSSSTFDFNLSPYLSYDETKIIFEASNNQSLNTNISQVMSDASSLENIISIGEITNATQIKSPCYDENENVFLEVETDAERIWKINVGGSPEMINSSYTNDNSPVTLPGGKVISVFIGSSTHQIKTMDNSGVNLVMLSEPNAQFEEVFDIGISAGGSSLSMISKIDNSLFTLYPNPVQNLLTIIKNTDLVYYKIYDIFGKLLLQDKFNFSSQNETLSLTLISGNYIFEVENSEGVLFQQKLIVI